MDKPESLREAAQAVVDRWDSPKWKDEPHTAVFIVRLRAALAAPVQGDGNPVGIASAMPGSGGGFTMCAFKGSDVPVGTELYTAPPAQQAVDLSDNKIIGVAMNIAKGDFWRNAHDDHVISFARALLAAQKGESK